MKNRIKGKKKLQKGVSPVEEVFNEGWKFAKTKEKLKVQNASPFIGGRKGHWFSAGYRNPREFKKKNSDTPQNVVSF